MAKPLLLNGKPFDPAKPTNGQLKVKAFLDGVPNEVFTRQELADKCGVGRDTVWQFGSKPHFKDYVFLNPRDADRRYFGHPSALKRFQKKIAERLR